MQIDNAFGTDETKYWQVLEEIIKRAAKDKSFERRFISKPEKVFGEAGLELPPGISLEVVKCDERTRYIFLPPDAPSTSGLDGRNESESIRWAGIVATLEKADTQTIVGVTHALGNGQWWMIIPDP